MIIMVPDPLGPALSLVIKSGTALSKMEISYMTALKGQDLGFFLCSNPDLHPPERSDRKFNSSTDTTI